MHRNVMLKEGIYNLLKDHTENDEPVWKIFKQNNPFLAVYYDFQENLSNC